MAHTKISEIMQSAEYRSLISDEAELKKAICSECSFAGACDTSPIARNFDSHVLGDCPTEKYLFPMIEAYLEEREFFDKEFMATAQNMKKAYIEELMPRGHSRTAAMTMPIAS